MLPFKRRSGRVHSLHNVVHAASLAICVVNSTAAAHAMVYPLFALPQVPFALAADVHCCPPCFGAIFTSREPDQSWVGGVWSLFVAPQRAVGFLPLTIRVLATLPNSVCMLSTALSQLGDYSFGSARLGGNLRCILPVCAAQPFLSFTASLNALVSPGFRVSLWVQHTIGRHAVLCG